MEAKTESATKLKLTRTFDATPEDVFDALTEPDELSKWFSPTDDMEVFVDKFEARVGGAYRIEMRAKDGDVHTCIGKIREIDRPNRLAYTWSWEGGEMGDTLVTWQLRDTKKGTELVLTHDQFPNEEAAERHNEGWVGCLARLEKALS